MKTYWLRFGAGDPRTYSGLNPTLLMFSGPTLTGGGVSPPPISEISGSGMYYFFWGTTAPISFLADAATTSPGAQGRYVSGVLDPSDRADEYGTTLVGLGNTTLSQVSAMNIGTLGSTFGGVNTDPIDLFGYVKRLQENLEGNQSYIKTSGALQILSRGSSSVLANKTITNSVSTVIKT